MPWQCATCRCTVEVDLPTCPECGAQKASWTLHQAASRVFVVGGGTRLEAFRGDGAERPASDAAWAAAAWSPTETAVPLDEAEVRRLLSEGRLPAPAELTTVRLSASKSKAWKLLVEVNFETRAVAAVELPRPAPAEGAPGEVRLLFVRGAGGVADLDVPGVVCVDVGEEAGHAPTVDLSALRKKKRLRLEAGGGAAQAALERVEVCDRAFHPGGAVLLPTRRQGKGEEGDGGLTGLAAVGAALRRLRAAPDRRVLVCGHAAADEARPADLARERARGVALLLSGDREGWAEHAGAAGRCEDWQLILTWIARERGWDCAPGGVDGKEGPLSRAALKKMRVCYRKLFGREAGRSESIAREDWAALFDCMQAHLAGIVGVKADELRGLQAGVGRCEPAWRGFGAEVPRGAAGAPHRSEHDRRADLLLFPPAAAERAGGAIYPLQGGALEVTTLPVDPDTYTPGQDGLEHHEEYRKDQPKQPDPHKASGEYPPAKWKKGEQGDHIKVFQEKLLALGYPMPRWGADGDLGEECLSAIKYFQDAAKVPGENAMKQLGAGEKTIEAVHQAWLALPEEKRSPKPKPSPGPPPSPPLVTDVIPDYSTFRRCPDPLHPPGLEDHTAFGDRKVRHKIAGQSRPWSKITGITLHQTACFMGNRPQRYYDLHAHIAVTTDCKIFYIHPMTDYVWHGHLFNDNDVGIEIDGNYAGIEGNKSTWWKPPGWKGGPMSCSDEHLQAVRDCIEWICATVAANGGQIKYIHAHRQTFDMRISDPGSRIWLNTGRWARKVLGLIDGGPKFKLGSGRPIPEVWDPDYVGVKYQ